MEIHDYIKNWIGVPYKWGGSDRSGIDCSGLVLNIYKDFYKKPLSIRTTNQMLENFQPVKLNDIQPGDLLFFNTIKGPEVDHVGLYLGNNEFVHAGSKGVVIANVSSPYWRKAFVTARHVE